MISKKRNLKLFRLIICLVVAVAASSMFLTIEPMASENVNPDVVAAVQEEVELQTFRAYSKGAPSIPFHFAVQPADATQNVTISDIEIALASLPEPEIEDETVFEEPVYEEVYEEIYEEESSVIEEEYEEIYEEESSVIEEEYEEVYEEESSDIEEESEEVYEEESSDIEEESEEVYEEESSIVEEESETIDESEAVEEESSETEDEPEVEEEENEEGSLPEVSAPGTYSDLEYLAAICQIEAGYNYDGCLAVANVILNRVNAGFGSSVYDVIYAPYQFATGWMEYYLQNGTSSTAREAAAAALAGSNNVGSYLYFNGTTWLDPETLDCPYVVIGGNVFY